MSFAENGRGEGREKGPGGEEVYTSKKKEEERRGAEGGGRGKVSKIEPGHFAGDNIVRLSSTS